jgi:hypothetical protein
MKNNNNNLSIFTKNINNKYKLLPFNIIHNHLGPTKYLPPVSKEWKNTVYEFNSTKTKNYHVYDANINTLIKGYFDLRFNHEFIFDKYIPDWKKRLSMNKIYVSKAEIKHTNSKALITIYTFNKEKLSLLRKVQLLRKSLNNSLRRNFRLMSMLNYNTNFSNLFKNLNFFFKDSKILTFFMLKQVNNDRRKLLNNLLPNKMKMKIMFYYYIMLLRKYKLRLNLNKYKFEEKFLYKLSSLISKFYNKKVVFNVVNMKSFVFNSDFFTKILTLKLKNKKIQVMRWILYVLNRAVLPKVNRIKEKGQKKKTVDFDLLENKFNNLNVISHVKDNNLFNLLNELYYNTHKDTTEGNHVKLHEIIFNSIKFKNMGGIRLEVAGRLTRRYRADRALFKVKWKGGLKNIDSSYKGLSSVNMRGYVNPNVEYSVLASKRRVGSFAIKGWVSGK